MENFGAAVTLLGSSCFNAHLGNRGNIVVLM